MSERIVGNKLSTLNLPPLPERPLTPSPLPSPTRRSISYESSSSSLDEAKQALLDAVSKRGTKASTTSIDVSEFERFNHNNKDKQIFCFKFYEGL